MPARYELTAEQWRKLEPFLPGKATDRGRTGTDNRLFVNGCLWVIRSGAMWHHLPERYGPWKRTYNRFRRWAHAGVWEKVFEILLSDSKNRYRMIDSSIVRAHQHATTGRGVKKNSTVGRSRGGLTTKLHLVTDGTGKPVKFQLTAGHTADCTQAESLLEGQTAEAVLADKGYDTDSIVHYVKHCMKAVAVIPPKRNRIVQRLYEKDTYKMRNLIERAFNRFKHWRRIATRYDRCDSIFISSIALAAIAIWA